MHLDVIDLRTFYYRTHLGRSAQRVLQEALRSLWPETCGLTVVGYGFAAPVLRPFLADARRVIALMPSGQGVMAWPVGSPNLSVLVEETRWPIETGSVDRIIVIHGLETSDTPATLMPEIWRVLAAGGRAAFIVPNRSGLWARRDVTPFGHGRPYSLRQIEDLMRRHRFEPERHGAALYAPPTQRRFWVRTSYFLERLGRRFEPRVIAGALIAEATKQVYARPPSAGKVAVPGPLDVLEGLSLPFPEPARGHREAS